MSTPGWYSPVIRVLERPDMLSSTRRMFLLRNATVVCWSIPILRILLAHELSGVTFATWHDEPLNCATWTDAAGCRCEVDP